VTDCSNIAVANILKTDAHQIAPDFDKNLFSVVSCKRFLLVGDKALIQAEASKHQAQWLEGDDAFKMMVRVMSGLENQESPGESHILNSIRLKWSKFAHENTEKALEIEPFYTQCDNATSILRKNYLNNIRSNFSDYSFCSQLFIGKSRNENVLLVIADSRKKELDIAVRHLHTSMKRAPASLHIMPVGKTEEERQKLINYSINTVAKIQKDMRGVKADMIIDNTRQHFRNGIFLCTIKDIENTNISTQNAIFPGQTLKMTKPANVKDMRDIEPLRLEAKRNNSQYIEQAENHLNSVYYDAGTNNIIPVSVQFYNNNMGRD
jgi:hypothetical protein